MGRPARHDADSLLDAAVRLVAAGGPKALTMAAVARAAGGPSGSVYHRFAGRPSLAAALWLRTVERFQAGFFAALAAGRPAGAARHVVAWCREHPGEANVLLYRADDFDREHWSDEERAALDAMNRRAVHALRDLGGDFDKVVLALVDLPSALVRRHLRAGGEIPARAEELVEETAVLILETCL
ncbi:helix-turn-helix domain-containing protein [Dactylosporangium sp. NPDC051541]|uniref:helix-turn-helix domain-containing protein n=1 Tax=Dactylosporangium sp. NPDC051541 TaxID=3363977 RepID=UPI0037B23848